ncbi:MAG: ABC transporter permease subunit [Acetatifactor sp.]|nr:ABC transporter permease subunit [Acetatifactor sp.]
MMNRNKVVIGLNFKYFSRAFIATVLTAICLFLPFVSMEEKSVNALAVLTGLFGSAHVGKMTIVLAAGIVMAVLSLIFAVINYVKPSKALMRLWICSGAIQCFCYTVLMFGTKVMVDGTGVLPAKFMVRDFGFGYWIGLLGAYVALWFTMKVAKVNPGYIVLTILSVIWLFPILWILLTSFRAEQGYYVGYFIPRGFTFDNYLNLFKNNSVIPFARWWTNTFIVAVCWCVFNTLIILGTAYVLSRTRFQGRTTLMKAMMVIGMFPGFMSMIAVYNILKGVGLAQTLTALIVVGVAGAAMGYYICKGFFDTIPKAMDEAAIIDGANRWQIFTRITIPLSKPIIIYTALTSFLGAWSDYIFPSILFGDKQASYTVAVGLKWLTDFRRIDANYTQFAAGSIMVALPIVILFIALQGFYVEGLSGSVKG